MQVEEAQQVNQTLKDNNLEMKQEQRKVLDELEKQLSSLISEKEKLEERQVNSSAVKPNSRGETSQRNSIQSLVYPVIYPVSFLFFQTPL